MSAVGLRARPGAALRRAGRDLRGARVLPAAGVDLDLAVFALSATLFAAAVLINGQPWLITDTIRYGGMLPGLADSSVLLNVLMRLPYAVAGLWGPSALGILAAAYALGRLAALDVFHGLRWGLPLVAALSFQYIYAGLVSAEIWSAAALSLLCCLGLHRRPVVLDAAPIAVGAVAHPTMALVCAGTLGLILILFPARWPRVLAGVACLALGLAAEAAAWRATLPGEPAMRNAYLAGEILSNHPDIHLAFCEAEPEAVLCTPPLAGFIERQRADPAHADQIDGVFAPGRTQLFVWGPTSFTGYASDLPPQDRLSRAEVEAAAGALWGYALRHHPDRFLAALPAKAASFWDSSPPGIWIGFSTWRADPRITPHAAEVEAVAAAHADTLQARGALHSWRYHQVNLLIMRGVIVVGLAAPLVLLLIGSPAWRLATLFAGIFAGNFLTVAIAGAVIGRYVERVLIFPGLNGLLLAGALWLLLNGRARARKAGGEPGESGAGAV